MPEFPAPEDGMRRYESAAWRSPKWMIFESVWTCSVCGRVVTRSAVTATLRKCEWLARQDPPLCRACDRVMDFSAMVPERSTG